MGQWVLVLLFMVRGGRLAGRGGGEDISHGAADSNGIPRFRTDATDQNQHTTHIFSDVRQLNVQITDALGGTTVFDYDAIGQLTASTDAESHTTRHRYDLGGRRISRCLQA